MNTLTAEEYLNEVNLNTQKFIRTTKISLLLGKPLTPFQEEVIHISRNLQFEIDPGDTLIAYYYNKNTKKYSTLYDLFEDSIYKNKELFDECLDYDFEEIVKTFGYLNNI